MDESISPATVNPAARRDALRELAVLFLRLGTLSMGGPAAHIAMMEDEVVRRRRWMTNERFLDMLGVCNLIPGPNSTEMAIHVGHLRAGFAGLVVAGACFIMPAAAIVLAIAWMYVRFGTMPQAVGLLYGIKPVIIAVVLQALWGLGRTAIKTRMLAALAIVSLAAALLDVNDMIVLLGGGIVMIAIRAFELIEGILRDPFTGIGKPEPLKYVLAGCWSRRLTQEHRIVYRVSERRIDFLQGRYHY